MRPQRRRATGCTVSGLMHERSIYASEHAMFREAVRRFFQRELEPNIERWEREGIIPRSFWRAAGDNGLLCCQVPERYGGPGADFRFNMVCCEEIGYAIGGGSVGFPIHSDIVAHYLLNHGTEAQKRRFLPPMVRGECIAALGMTEPGAGSDLQAIRTTARRRGDEYVIDGQKTFITNGGSCDFVLLACKTGEGDGGGGGISLILVEADRPGFERGRHLDKIGLRASDTAELFFNGVRVPVANRLGEQGKGFGIMMRELPRERLAIAFRALGEAQRAFELTVDYVRQRKVFGRAVLELQNTQFVLAELKAELAVGWSYLDQCLERIVRGELRPEEGAIAKLCSTETEGRIVDRCLQLFGGYGYMREYPISRLFVDARVRRIYGGSSEIMKLVIARSL